MKKLQSVEELGVPVSRNGSVSGPKSQNGYAPPKPPSGSPSPRLSKTPTHLPTILDEPGKKAKKSAPLQHFSPSPRTSQGFHGTSDSSGGRSESHRQASWDGRSAVLPTSPKLPAGVTANGHGPKGGDESPDPERRDSSSSSPEHSASSGPAKTPQTPRSAAAHFCDSQGTNSSAAGPSKVLLDGEGAKVVKPKSPVLNSTASEPASTMSPPPAKKLALSAKKVGVWESCRTVREQVRLQCGRSRTVQGIWPPLAQRDTVAVRAIPRAVLGWRRALCRNSDRRMMLRVAGGGLGRQGSSPFLSGDKIP